MKMFKKILKIIPIIIVGLIAIGFITETTLTRLDLKKLVPPGDIVEVYGKNMHMYSVREGEKWSRLSHDNRVVVVERFGYGKLLWL